MKDKTNEYKLAMHKLMHEQKFNTFLLRKLTHHNINTIYGVLNGKRTTFECVWDIAKVLNLDPHEFMLYRLKNGVEQSNKEKAEVLDYMVRQKMISGIVDGCVI